jgi:hypothetical protein
LTEAGSSHKSCKKLNRPGSIEQKIEVTRRGLNIGNDTSDKPLLGMSYVKQPYNIFLVMHVSNTQYDVNLTQ